MAKQTVIHEVGKVLTKRLSDHKVVASSVTQMTQFAQQVQQDFLKGGWGNRDLYVINSSKEVSGNVKNAFFDLDFMAMQQGVKIENETISVWEDESLTVSDSGTVKIAYTPLSKVSLTNEDGDQQEFAVSDKTITVPETFATKGNVVTAHYQIEVDAETVEISGEKFSENYYFEIHTLEYDPKTSKIYSDLYIQLPKVNFSGEADMSLEAGQAYTPEIGYRALADDNGKIGTFARVKRNPDGTKGVKTEQEDVTSKSSVDIGTTQETK
ncbi:hypothetical protein LC728_09885 [Bacillus amyloliquefaciens]|uniref:hypothetical protein n=1 Tax=Bacillus TaxID=1386 RepID=UPI001CD5E2C2|nr:MULTISPECIES: hypothetical protein [Bacillus amyloliquefaciens group]MCA1214694.1 hypothetical protein [Bacillus amyloliquefaciens]WJM64584.1 hypothetical protein QTN48_12195 [Bacillus velezensis]